jgi:hypothetical protein
MATSVLRKCGGLMKFRYLALVFTLTGLCWSDEWHWRAHWPTLSAHIRDARSMYFHDETVGRGFDPQVIRGAQTFTMALQDAGAENALLAAGAALAYGVPSLYLIRERHQLPWFLREAERSYPGLVEVWEGEPAERVRRARWEALGRLRGGELPNYNYYPGAVSTFIGCMMTGLTPQEYDVGRSHLQEIDAALRDHLGEAPNYCEGLNVPSSDSFGQPRRSLPLDLEVIRKCERCVFYVFDAKSRPSSMWVELGAALAWGKPSVLLTPSMQGLPPRLREQPPLPGLRIEVYPSHEQLMSDLKSEPGARKWLRPAVHSSAAEPNDKW